MMLMIRMRWAFALLLGLMLAANAGSVAAAAPSLAATPVEDVVTGTSTITWDTGDGSVGQVYVAVIEDREGRAGGITGDRLFVTGAAGSQDAPWIAYSSAYRFSLYAGLTHQTLLSSFVFRVTFSERLSADPNPVPAGTGLGTTQIMWGSPRPGLGAPGGAVFVSMDGATQVLFADGEGGTNDAPWIQTGHRYVFSLYTFDNVSFDNNTVRPTGPPLKSITVTRQG